MVSLLRAVWTLQLAALGLSSVSWAEPPHGAQIESPVQGVRARLLAEAEQAIRDGLFAKARDAYLVLWEATRDPDAGCNVGRISYRIGDMVRAVEFLSTCVATNPTEERDVKIELAEARRAIAEVRVRAAPAAQVTIDGRPRGLGAVTVYLVPGRHTFRATGEGQEEPRTIDAVAGEVHMVDLRPTGSTTPSPGPRGALIAAGAIASGVLVGLGLALTVSQNDTEKSGDARLGAGNHCFVGESSRCGYVARNYETATTLDDWRNVVLVAGAAAGAATLTYTIFPRGRVTVSPVGARVSLGGVW